MITEEKLQKFLDDLRIGKYDTLNYQISSQFGGLKIKDINKNVSILLQPYKSYSIPVKSHWWNKKEKQIGPPNYYIMVDDISKDRMQPNIIQECVVSEKLFNSWVTFIKEQTEKEKLISRSNIESAFDL